MSAPGAPLTKEGLADQARYVLQALLADSAAGNPSYLSALRVRLSRAAPVPVEEQIAFLEKFGYLLVNRTNNVLTLTRDGELVAHGDKGGDLLGDVVHFFDARLKSLGRGMVAASRKLAGEVLDDRYRKVGQVGSGGVGTVYRGQLISTERPVAIKIVREVFAYFTELQRKEVVRRLDTVVRSAARLQHPNVVQVLDCNLEREHPYVVTQLAPSGNLRRVLAVDEPMAPSRVVAYFLQMCHALRSAHLLGITHRALKPENVLFDLYGNAVVSDFGMSRIVERDASVIHQVFVGMGSVAYLAPEQFADPRNADPRSDIYALGILLYEMCTRRLPGRRSAMPSEVNRELPKGLDDVFDQMTQDAPEDRFGSIQEVLEAVYAAPGVEAHLDRRRAVLFAESPSLDLPLDADDSDDAPLEAAPGVPGGPLTFESPPLGGSEPIVPSRGGVLDRTDIRIDAPRPDMGMITEDRIVAPAVPVRPGEERVTPPPRGPTTVEPRSRGVVDAEFDDVGPDAEPGGGQAFAEDVLTGDDLYDDRHDARLLPGSDPRKRAALRRGTPPQGSSGSSSAVPRKPAGGGK